MAAHFPARRNTPPHPRRVFAAAPASPLSRPLPPASPASVGLALSLAACAVLALAAYWGG